MSAITATLDVEDDISALVVEMLRQFPKGARIKLTISEVTPPESVPNLEEYRQIIDDARRQAPIGPWQTTADTMRALREGEGE